MTLVLDRKLSKILNMAQNARGTRETARLSLDCLDLTSLRGDETKADIHNLCDMAQFNKLASICIYPDKIDIAKKALKSSPVVIATVINFPYGNKRTLSNEKVTPDTVKEDVSRAIKDGARQIDIVLPYQEFMDGNTLPALQSLKACKKAWSPGVTLKVIFETAAFESDPEDRTDDLRRACRLAVTEGFNCLKTSTGKHLQGGATLEAAAILMDEAKKAISHNVGVKIAGGVKTNDDCARYITLARGIRCDWGSVRPDLFRIGASSLIDVLLKDLGSGGTSLSSYEQAPN